MFQIIRIDIKEGDLIRSPTTQYEVQHYLGVGAYGYVTRCKDLSTNETVALKMIRSQEDIQSANEEEAILKTMNELDSEKFNIVKLKDAFTYRGHYWLVFENLDIDLHSFMSISPGNHLELKQIRPILQQLATSLEFLKSAGVIHADLKPQNIMMVDRIRQPLKVKVIDFGLATKNPEEMTGQVLQPLIYRSPEIIQKVPFNEAIDVWSLGCIAAELFMGQYLFDIYNESELMNLIVHTCGVRLGEQDLNSYHFWPQDWMKTRFMNVPRLWGDDDEAEACDMKFFIDLLKSMLLINPKTRITPTEILKHPFITMSHLKGPFKKTSYVKSCKDMMDICKDDGGHRDQMIQQTSLNKDSSLVKEDSQKTKAKGGNKPDNSQAKKRKREQLAATQKDQSGQTGPVKSQRKRKRDEPTSDGDPLKKKKDKSLRKS